MDIKESAGLAMMYLKENKGQTLKIIVILAISLIISIFSFYIIFDIDIGVKGIIENTPYANTIERKYINYGSDEIEDIGYDNKVKYIITNSTEHLTYSYNSAYGSNNNPKPNDIVVSFESSVKIEEKTYSLNKSLLDKYYLNEATYDNIDATILKEIRDISIVVHDKEHSNTMFSDEAYKMANEYDERGLIFAGDTNIKEHELLVSNVFCDCLGINYNDIVGKKISYFNFYYILKDDNKFDYKKDYAFKDFVVKGVYNDKNCDYDGRSPLNIGEEYYYPTMMILLKNDINYISSFDEINYDKVNLVVSNRLETQFNQRIYFNDMTDKINYLNVTKNHYELVEENVFKSLITLDPLGYEGLSVRYLKAINMAGIILLYAGITVFFSTMVYLISVLISNFNRRNGYIGMIKAIGVQRKDITLIFLIEQISVVLFSSFIAIAITIIPILGIHYSLYEYMSSISVGKEFGIGYTLEAYTVVIASYLLITIIISLIFIKKGLKTSMLKQLVRN